MRVLVTGGAGFIGSHTVDALLVRGHQVRVLDSLEPPVHTAERPSYLHGDVQLISGSVADRRTFLQALRGVDAVFHLAAYQDYQTDFSRYFMVNSVGTALLYELIVNEHLPIQKVVVASTQAIYGEGKYRCEQHGVQYPSSRPSEQLERSFWEVCCPACATPMEPEWTDEAVAVPHNSYGLSKRDAEEITLKLGRRYGIPSVALRYSIVQGPRQSFRNAYSGAMRAFAVRALTGHAPVMYEDGHQDRDFVSIHDVVRANMLALEDSRADFTAFNVGAGRRVSVRDLANLVVAEVGGSEPPEAPGLYRVGDTRHIFSDISRLRALGWAPRVSQADMVREYVAWAAEQPGLRDTFSEAQQNMLAAGVLRRALHPV